MICLEKHLPDVPDEDFNCPKCGARVGDFYVEDGHADGECEKISPDDAVTCAKCGHGESARAFVRRWLKAKNLVPCDRCKGRGVVDRSQR